MIRLRHNPLLWLGIPLLLLSCAATADEEFKWYTVELVVFQHLGTAGLEEEVWPDEPGAPDLTGSIELGVSSPLQDEAMAGEPGALTDTPRAFMALPAKELTLTKAVARLRRSKGYRPMLHLAWRQPGFPRAESRAVHLRIGPKPAAAPVLRDNLAIWTEPEPIAAPLEGTVRLYLSRYLHVQADLLYFRPAEQAPTPAPQAAAPEATGGEDGPSFLEEEARPPTRFRLTGSVRMRSNELHYLDHPLFGMLVKVTPYVPPEPAVVPSPIAPPPPTSEKVVEQ